MVATLVRPPINDILHGEEDYDGDENSNWEMWRNRPFQIGALDDNLFDETDIETEYPAAMHQAMYMLVRDSRLGWTRYATRRSTYTGGTWLWTIDELLTFSVIVVPEGTTVTTGTAKVTFRMPRAFRMLDVRASLKTASSSGAPAIDVNKNGTTAFSTVITIDASEKTSVTAATAAVFTDSAARDWGDDDEITIDVDTAGTGADGLKLTFRGIRA